MVLGATGKTGRRLVHTLRTAGRTVRAASRSGEIRFDWSDQDTWPTALEGASAVYLIAPEDPALAPIFVKQATEAGVARFVALSGRGIDQVPVDSFQGMTAAEQAVRDSGAQWTILRPNNFNQNFDDDVWRAPLRDGRLALPIGSVPEPFIDAQDIADVAAAVLTSDGHHGQVYDLSGPRALTFGTAVATIAKAAGRPIRYVELTPEEYRAELLAEGVSEEAAAELNVLFAGMRAGHFAEPADGVRRVLGRDPVDFDTYATRAAAAGAWS
ncbi:NmrA family protein [Streptomyces bingchenggensis BCW-1]|uniref:NmrA family protein n=1 Tax=Streptomyces bingchenggensis (strain BCW-1) TaxID=749414 RepID=D7BQ35_STRBB|nr:NmrA family protein [Streptomyces bingchenggensis BCW-1]